MDDGICLNSTASLCQNQGQDVGFLGSHLTWVLFPGVACTLNEACGHQQDELWTRGFCWWCPVMPKKVISWFWEFSTCLC